MAAKVFIDGAAGTTGIEIRERLAARSDISLLELSDAQRKDANARKEALNESDLVILCLPDDAARESISLIENNSTRVIDASTAHRTASGWAYGFPELEEDQRAKIASSARVSNPGCWPTGFLALMRPLICAGIVPADFPATVTGVSGYSGGGKSMIEEFEAKDSARYVGTVFRTYALTLSHKHAPEMREHSGLTHSPVFSPNVGRFYRGMLVEVPLQLWALPSTPAVFELHRAIADAYRHEPLVEVSPFDSTLDAAKAIRAGASNEPPTVAMPATLDAEALKLTNGMKLYVFGNDKTQQARLIAVLDNLGKGASGAAVQNMNIMLGLPETTGLL